MIDAIIIGDSVIVLLVGKKEIKRLGGRRIMYVDKSNKRLRLLTRGIGMYVNKPKNINNEVNNHGMVEKRKVCTIILVLYAL